jgi:hypothetical protein
MPALPQAWPKASETNWALIGVMDQPGFRASAREGHLQGVDDEIGAHVIRHRPAQIRRL